MVSKCPLNGFLERHWCFQEIHFSVLGRGQITTYVHVQRRPCSWDFDPGTCLLCVLTFVFNWGFFDPGVLWLRCFVISGTVTCYGFSLESFILYVFLWFGQFSPLGHILFGSLYSVAALDIDFCFETSLFDGYIISFTGKAN